jgi:hypothetical protein
MRTRTTIVTVAPVVLGLAISMRAATMARIAEPVAPPRLIDTGLYQAGQPGVGSTPGQPGQIDARNRPFSPQYPLWSDGATKRRWVYLPPGALIDAANGSDWNLPVGTRFWKEFSFGGRKVETRFMWRASAGRWVFASYAWNADGTDAVLASADGVFGVAELSPGRQHAIPSVSDCHACHESTRVTPLGFNALQLSTDRDPGAIHGEPLEAGMVTLATLAAQGRLHGARADLLASPPRIRTDSAATRSVLGYLAANCGGCHNRESGIALLGGSLKHSDVLDGDAVVRAMTGRRTIWQRPGAVEGETRLIDSGSPETSALVTRMQSRRPSSQMPPLGTAIGDRVAIEHIARWMRTLGRDATRD